MRVLLVAYHYPPDPAVGAVRAGRVAAALVEAGHEVEVISIREGDAPRNAVANGIRVRRVRRALDPRQALVSLKRMATLRRAPSNGNGGAAPAARFDRNGATAWRPPTEVADWRRYLGSLLFLPDDQQGWIPSVVASGLRRIAGGVDLVYTTAPPYSAHVAGLILKALTGVRWIAEMRDPWIGNPWKPWWVRSRGADAVDSWLERRCLHGADRVVAVTAAAAREMASRRREPGSVVLVRNGIPPLPDRTGQEPLHAADERLIVYVGSLYHRRDPRPFLQGLATLKRAGRLPRIRVEFIGNCTHYEGAGLAELCAELDLADVVRFVPPIPHAECQERIRSADLLLLLAQEQPAQVPQKLYEYMATGLPMIAFADADGETAEMLREIGGHYLITDSSADSIARALDTALHAERRPPATDGEVMREWSSGRQMQKLVQLVEEVVT